MHKCFSCDNNLIWQNDYNTEDVGHEDSEYLIISMYQCSNKKCNAWHEVYHSLKEEELN